MNKPNDEFEKLIAPFEVMAGGLYSKECVKAVAQWAFFKAFERVMGYGTDTWNHGMLERIAQSIQDYAKEVSNERRP